MIPPMGRARFGRTHKMTLGLFRSPTIYRRQRFHEIDYQPTDQAYKALLASLQIARNNHAWTCWNPGNALPLQDRSVEVWPRREHLHLFACIYRHTTGAAQKASLYSMLDKAGSMTHRSKSDVRRVPFTDKWPRRQVLSKAGSPAGACGCRFGGVRNCSRV